MQQKEICINEVMIPIIEYEGGEKYYPLSYMGNKVLLKELTGNQLIKNGYGKYIKQLEINYGENTGGLQLTYCISEEGLKAVLLNCRIARLSIEQKIVMKKVCEYINLNIEIDTEEKFLDNYSKDKWGEYGFWSAECIQSVLDHNPDIKWQRCSKCGKYYPYAENFFDKEGNITNKQPLRSICKECKQYSDIRCKLLIKHYDKELNRIYHKYGEEIYLMFKQQKYLEIWLWYIQSDYKSIPSVFKNKEYVLNIIKHLYDTGKIKDNNINSKDIDIILGFDTFNHCKLKISDMYIKLFGIDLFHKEGSGVETFEDAKQIFLNYLERNNIVISYTYNLWELIEDIGLITYLKNKHNNDILDFVIKIYDYNYGAYKFEGGYKKHWEFKENRNKALKYLIEKDMKIPIEKVPLYLTLENMRKQSNTMRNLLRKHYDNNIWNWVNDIYPNRFDEEDFNVTVIRNVFDSAEESMIHDILTGKFKNVLYNQRNTKNSITIMGMQPDWFIFTNNGIWVVEYFGISVYNKTYNQRTEDYKKKTLSKIEKYKEMNWLRTVYVYPEDLKDNYSMLEEKLSEIV